MSMNMVREALVGSDTKTFFSVPPFSLNMSQASTVPKARSPLSYTSFTLGSFFNSHSSFVTEGYEEMGRPHLS